MWDVRNGKAEIRVFMLTSHFSFPKWNFDTKKLNWAPRNGKRDSNEDSRDLSAALSLATAEANLTKANASPMAGAK